MVDPAGDEKEIAGPDRMTAGGDPLAARTRQVEDDLRRFVVVQSDLGLTVPVELELADGEIERLNLHFLDENRTPSWHSPSLPVPSVRASF